MSAERLPAPTYFSPVQIKSMYGQIFSLIDGGMFANNPALCAYAEARKIPFAEVLKNHQKANHPVVNDMIIISIGTGIEARPYLLKAEKAGKIGWVSPIIDI
jgi:patatin-like phospholipase/acyl hydrolase